MSCYIFYLILMCDLLSPLSSPPLPFLPLPFYLFLLIPPPLLLFHPVLFLFLLLFFFLLLLSFSLLFLSLFPGCDSPRQASLCIVAVHECLRCMYDSELVIRSGALSALKKLCVDAGGWCGVVSHCTTDQRYNIINFLHVLLFYFINFLLMLTVKETFLLLIFLYFLVL